MWISGDIREKKLYNNVGDFFFSLKLQDQERLLFREKSGILKSRHCM